ncbi:putative membrane protein [Candidatus Ichthyocystis hellenicum]|uniref:Putative membrane protein n=2 Tax=Candidatus Ichthyocystis TaxID=2929841 RepID=A0A0S4M043_9BURK|nr:hypothetical protein [Candidatus Ichthyocystis hellenicum]CUT17193.1 putative membrane protein [Candidatus Ichthyocystis hellenicum]
MEQEVINSGRGVVCIRFSSISPRVTNRYRLRVGYCCNQERCRFLPRCVGVSFFYKYFYFMVAFFLLGMVSKFYGESDDIDYSLLSVLHMACPMLSILLLGAVAGFSFPAEEVIVRVLSRLLDDS